MQDHPEKLYMPQSGPQIARPNSPDESTEYFKAPDCPYFVLRADDPDALDALCMLGTKKEKPDPERDVVLQAALAFKVYKDQAK